MENFLFLWYFTFVTLFLICSVPQPSVGDKEIPLTKISSNGISAPTLKFLYCYSCGYRKLFDDYANIIYEKYPTLIVDGANYDPPGLNMLLARFIGIVKIFVIILVMSSLDVFTYLRQPTPSWWTWCLRNKLYACMMVFFLSNMVEGHLISSGAFEIFLNDVPVWSKLDSGRIPQPNELYQIIDNHMQFADRTVELKPGFAK